MNLIILVSDDRSLNQEKCPTDRGAYDDLMMSSNVNLARVVGAMGCYAERVDRPTDIGSAMASAFASGHPAVLDMLTNVEAIASKAREEDVASLN